MALSNIKRVPNKPVFIYTAQSSVKWVWWAAVKRAAFRSYLSTAAATASLRPSCGRAWTAIAKLGHCKSAQHVLKTYGHANGDKTLTDLIAGKFLTEPVKSEPETKLKTGT